ncbi:MAG: conjugal transfer protein TraD [Xanthobacteraceae bacterium]
MQSWQVERRRRTRHLIELGGLVVKAGIVDLTGDDRTMIYGAMFWIADKLQSEDGERARGVWTKLGEMAFTGSHRAVRAATEPRITTDRKSDRDGHIE